MNLFLKSILMASFLLGVPSSAYSWDEPEGICMARKCGLSLASCGLESECRQWLSCVTSCGEDNIKCPSFCGFFNQSKRINKVNQCVMTSACVDLGFAQYPDYQHQDRKTLDIEGIEGTYWFAGYNGGDHVFDYDCQRFDFSEINPKKLYVNFSVPLSKGDKTKLTSAQGTLEQLASGAIEVKYENFVGYHELWYLVNKTPNTLLMHVCFTKGQECHDYGTLLLSKLSLDDLDISEQDKISRVANSVYGFQFNDLKESSIKECLNSSHH